MLTICCLLNRFGLGGEFDLPVREDSYRGYDDREMFLRVWSPDGDAKAVVLGVHGLGSHSGLIAPVGEYFEKHGFVFYAPDLRGFGHYSGIKGHVESIDEFVKDLDGLVDRLKEQHPGKKIFMWGHSFGGLLTILYAEQHQHKLDGIMIVCPGLSERLKISSFVRAIVKILSALNVKKPFENGLNLDLISRNPETVRRNKEDPLRYDYATARFAAEGFKATRSGMEAAVSIAIPALVQQSGDDLIVVPEKTREFYDRLASADKTWRIYEGLYHEPFEEEGGEAVLKDAIDWIESHL
ncbi:MAG: hypothetical protein DRO73_08300 [Candidatus Thorarchaeota archaeon]|nr:MAG: hypothetical protein DRO73_08300 [Candidatus Thorarchaeota archaeon]